MSNVIHFNDRCDICARSNLGRHKPVKGEDDQSIKGCVRCPACLEAFGEHDDVFTHVMGQCEPEIDMDTRWELLSLFANLVRHRDRSGDPKAAALVDQLGRIIERHEPSRGGDL